MSSVHKVKLHKVLSEPMYIYSNFIHAYIGKFHCGVVRLNFYYYATTLLHMRISQYAMDDEVCR